MELTELVNKFMELLKVEKIEDAPNALMQVLLRNETKYFDDWLKSFADLTTDNLQPIYQYYMADRKNKMQDYTPKTLAKACAMLAKIGDANSCYDMCAGSGALTIQAWDINKNCNFICEEFDERVIPFLIFNLAIRNINATVINGDVLKQERFASYKLTPTEKYSVITKAENPKEIITDVCISNPPYNMRWEHELFMQIDKRFNVYGVPPESNANYAFVLTALAVAKRAVLIMPNGINEGGTKTEMEIRKNLADMNKIESVIINPDNMFESTSIGTCLFCINNNKTTIQTEMIDARDTYAEEKREQRGQFGGKSHTNRVYTKTVKTYTDDNIKSMLDAIANKTCKAGYCQSVNINDIKSAEYALAPSRYVKFKYIETAHRNYADIVADLNRVIAEKNCCKLVINETLAKRLGFDVDLYKKDAIDSNFTDFITKIAGDKILKSDYIQFTKSKNEFTFKNNGAEFISTILTSILQTWKQHIMYLNQTENRYLAELRDAVLPELMSGKLKV